MEAYTSGVSFHNLMQYQAFTMWEEIQKKAFGFKWNERKERVKCKATLIKPELQQKELE